MAAPVQTIEKALHLEMKVRSRAKGQSCLASDSYQNGTCQLDQRTGSLHNYGKKKGVDFRHKVGWDGSNEDLWNEVEAVEDRYANKPHKAQTAYTIVIAHPRELGPQGCRTMHVRVANFVHELTGAPVTGAAHEILDPDDPNKTGENPHSHYMFATRAYDAATKTWSRKKFDVFNQMRGGDGLEKLRAFVAAEFNAELDVITQGVRVEHESFRKRGIDKTPTQHLGQHAHYVALKEAAKAEEAEKKNEVYEPKMPAAVKKNQRIRERNRRRAEAKNTASAATETPTNPATFVAHSSVTAPATVDATKPLFPVPTAPAVQAPVAAKNQRRKLIDDERDYILNRLASPVFANDFARRHRERVNRVNEAYRKADSGTRNRRSRSQAADDIEREIARTEFAIAGAAGRGTKASGAVTRARAERARQRPERAHQLAAQRTAKRKIQQHVQTAQDKAAESIADVVAPADKRQVRVVDFSHADRLGQLLDSDAPSRRPRSR